MKNLLVILITVLCFTTSAQDWKTIRSADFTPLGFVFGGNGWRPGNKQFAVNQFDNSVWFAWDNYVHGFDSQGAYFKFDDSNVPVFDGNTNVSTILEIGFASNSVFAVDRFIGLMRFDGLNWTIISVTDEGNSICADSDSIWVANDQFGYTSWKDGFTTDHVDFTQMERLVSRKGEMWGSSGYDDGFLYKVENTSPNIQLASNHGYLLDDSNFDFKFAPMSDTLFVAGAQGISIAYGGAFIDTITMNNTIDMPSSSIREIEIDQNNNIWALFGTASDTNSAIAYFDFAMNTWTSIYNDSNSPIDWSGRVSIELDGQGNLYVCDVSDLHVLQINNWPQWLNTPEQNSLDFAIYPNPSSGEFTIEIDDEIEVSSIEVVDFNGRVVARLPFNTQLNLNVESGIYFVNLYNNASYIARKRLFISE